MDDDPKFPELVIAGLTKAANWLNSTTRRPTLLGAISIGDLNQKNPSGFGRMPRRLRLNFDDVYADKSSPNVLGGTIYEYAPKHEDVEKLVNWIEPFKGRTGKILVNCRAGVGRSVAAGFIIYCVFLGPGREEEAMNKALQARVEKDNPNPNVRMIELADEILGRGGALISTYNDFFSASPGMYS